MNAKDRIGDKNWDVYDDEVVVGPCKYGQGKIIDVYTVASHEKVPRVERDFDERIVRCKNSECPSK